MKGLCLLVFLSATFLGTLASTDRVVCYYGSWSVYRSGNGKFTVEDIDPSLCSLLIYTFVGIDDSDGSIKILDEYNEVTNGALKRFNALKSSSPSTKTSVAIGGWNEGSLKYSTVASSATKRQKLISDAVNFLQTYGFDGFDLDWEYPASRGGSASDKQNFVTLLQEFREEFDKYGFLLTAAVAATGSTVDAAYDIPNLSKYLDYIHVMTYDFHGSYDGVTGQNAPLYASSVDTTAAQKLLNVQASIKSWISNGADPAKLVLGIGEYGRSFTLSSTSNTKVGAPASAAGNSGPYTQEAGMLGYNEICELQLEGGWTVVFDEEQQVPYAYKGNQWVGYDNIKSVQLKVEFAKSYNLGGVMIWSVETDDFRGICGSKYPILNAIKSSLQISGTSNSSSSSSSTTASSSSSSSTSTTSTTAKPTTTTTKTTTTKTTTTTTTTTTAKPTTSSSSSSSSSECTSEGYFVDPNDCNTFYYCQYYRSSYLKYTYTCPTADLCYNPELQYCDYVN